MVKVRKELEKIDAKIAQSLPFQMVESDLRCKNVRVLKDGTPWLQELLKSIVSVSEAEPSYIISRFLDPMVLRSGALQVSIFKASAPGAGIPLKDLYKNYVPDTQVLNWIYDEKAGILNKVLNKVGANPNNIINMMMNNNNDKIDKMKKLMVDVEEKTLNLFALMDNETVLKTEGIFRVSGAITEINKLVEDLKRSPLKVFVTQMKAAGIHEKAALMKRVNLFCAINVTDIWLTGLQDISSSYALYDESAETLENKKHMAEKIKAQFALLPNYNLFYRTIKYLQQVVKYEKENLMNASNLAKVFVPNFYLESKNENYLYAPLIAHMIKYLP